MSTARILPSGCSNEHPRLLYLGTESKQVETKNTTLFDNFLHFDTDGVLVAVQRGTWDRRVCVCAGVRVCGGISCVNIIPLCVRGPCDGEKEDRRTYCRAAVNSSSSSVESSSVAGCCRRAPAWRRAGPPSPPSSPPPPLPLRLGPQL